MLEAAEMPVSVIRHLSIPTPRVELGSNLVFIARDQFIGRIEWQSSSIASDKRNLPRRSESI
jgi:hypothetical protein